MKEVVINKDGDTLSRKFGTTTKTLYCPILRQENRCIAHVCAMFSIEKSTDPVIQTKGGDVAICAMASRPLGVMVDK